MKIDIYTHILTEKYLKSYGQKASKVLDSLEARNRAVTDLNMRFRLMDRHPDVMHVLTVANPPLDLFVSASDCS